MSKSVTVETPMTDGQHQNDQPSLLVGYIRGMLQELQNMTPREAGYMLPYLIDMAREEAFAVENQLAAKGR